MNFVTEMREAYHDKKNKPRKPTDGNRRDWFDAAMQRPPGGRSIESVRLQIFQKNPVRMRRLLKDYKWLEKQMKAVGRNPEDARWLL